MVKFYNISPPDGYFKDTPVSYNDSGDVYVVPEKMKIVWAVMLDILKELERVCEKLNIKFFADSGTLLGAVRHKGFIPWDDDLDVIMLREDYDKLIANSAEFRAPFFLQTPFTDNYFDSCTKLRRSDTLGVISQDRFLNIDKGICIDIFVCDKIPDDKNKRERFYKNLKRYTIFGIYKKFYVRKFFSHIFRKDLLCTEHHIKKSRQLYVKMQDYCRQFSDTDCADCSTVVFVHRKNRRVIYPLSVFSKAQKVQFEWTEISIPSKWDEILNIEFGPSYMTPAQLPAMHKNSIFEIYE